MVSSVTTLLSFYYLMTYHHNNFISSAVYKSASFHSLPASYFTLLRFATRLYFVRVGIMGCEGEAATRALVISTLLSSPALFGTVELALRQIRL